MKEFGLEEMATEFNGSDKANWPNLLKNMRHFHSGSTTIDQGTQLDLWRMRKDGGEDEFLEHNTIVAMFDVVSAMKDKPWAEVEPLMLNFQAILAVKDRWWLEDEETLAWDEEYKKMSRR